ncbi:DUF547 domain-containing protein/Lzipper-MIP1 domain-containing protein [Cephalotus follicularis]|uniref:DUF547 domain-containing protein/Lzipper-MIP1 domain-containing protein n=1 Tax=Cephalotus follicularis TaxID=3775 RepID=A0A1Q3B3P9_CEPFO|nr:DUF547 domain-containing protein/Lzipper-MIP1 domain-containing protein [Cephalotus follicularis]
MASQGHLSVNISSEIRKKKLSGQQKIETLEREVSMLQKMLKQEEKMHEILEHINRRRDHGPITIPSFLSPKVKELLAELAMVEDEIAKLESQIIQLQIGLKQEEEITKETKSKQWQPGVVEGDLRGRPSNASVSSPLNRNVQERRAFETKALHFISKPIKGDYNLSDFNLHEKMESLRMFADKRQNEFLEEVKLQERVPGKTGLLKLPSPLRDPRHPSPKPRERNLETPLDLSEERIQNWQPNKLSESIMKCLNLIYIRLLRTSRAMELEKSGPISRSTYSSLGSRSFRGETSLSSKSSLMLNKESRQQDPYGIFNTEESIPRDIGPYKNLVIFTASSMDPKCISSSSSIPLLRKLRVLMNSLQMVDLRSLTFQQKLAFWINMYNSCIMHGFLQYGVPSTPDKLLTLMNKATLNIGGYTVNAQEIEHHILRKSASSSMREVQEEGDEEDNETIIRKLYGLESMDPNVIFALCCGTRSSPAVKIYTADGVVIELEKSKLEYLQASIVLSSTKRIAFPELLLRNFLDFSMDMDSLVEWVCHQLPTSGSLRKSMVDCFRNHNSGNISTTVEKIPYDYEFQYLLAM